MKIKRTRMIAAACLSLLLTGCANHLEDITKEVPENSRTVLENQYIVTADKEIPDSASFKITLEEAENVKVTVYQVRKYSTLYTPYEGWRESYEILSGICLLPVAVVSNVLSVFTFSMFPFSWSAEVTKYSFDGMNPCMNFESQSRAEEIPVKVERTLVDTYTETKRKPLADESLIIRMDKDVFGTVKTDALGQAEIHLLTLDLDATVPITSRHLDIYLEKNNALCKSIPLSRSLLARMNSARRALMKYYAAPNGNSLADCVREMERLSFEQLAFQLEEAELKKHPDFRPSFEQAFSN